MSNHESLEVYHGDYDAFVQRRRAYVEYMDREYRNVTYDVPEEDKITKRIKKIFKFSFPVSSGSPIAQLFLQTGALNILRSGVGGEAILAAFND